MQARQLQRQTAGLDRLLFFSDAVFAIALTLLILDVRLAKTEVPLTNQQLFDELVAVWPKIAAWVLSFAIVALFWIKHHISFRYIEAYDNRLIVLNFAQLLLVSFIPFPTSVLSEQGNGVATGLYAGTMAIGFLLSASIWWHASRHNLVVAEVSHSSQKAIRSSLAAAGVFAISAWIALYDAGWARLSWLLLIPVSSAGWWYRPGRGDS